METTRTHPNQNYRIGTDTLPTGKVRAKARGRKTTTRTFPAGTPHQEAAEAVARLIEGDRFCHVAQVSSGTSRTGALAADWAVYVGTGA
jgi:hypothetical protein